MKRGRRGLVLVALSRARIQTESSHQAGQVGRAGRTANRCRRSPRPITDVVHTCDSASAKVYLSGRRITGIRWRTIVRYWRLQLILASVHPLSTMTCPQYLTRRSGVYPQGGLQPTAAMPSPDRHILRIRDADKSRRFALSSIDYRVFAR